MAEKTPQTYVNHTRLDPPFHYFVIPIAAITILLTIWHAIRSSFTFPSIWMIVAALAGFVAAFKIRLYALKNQDRLIRLEERLRLAAALPEPLRSRIGELSEAQLIALRFASDAELPALAEKVLAGKMSAADIKKAIVNWRPDYFRI